MPADGPAVDHTDLIVEVAELRNAPVTFSDPASGSPWLDEPEPWSGDWRDTDVADLLPALSAQFHLTEADLDEMSPRNIERYLSALEDIAKAREEAKRKRSSRRR